MTDPGGRRPPPASGARSFNQWLAGGVPAAVAGLLVANLGQNPWFALPAIGAVAVYGVWRAPTTRYGPLLQRWLTPMLMLAYTAFLIVITFVPDLPLVWQVTVPAALFAATAAAAAANYGATGVGLILGIASIGLGVAGIGLGVAAILDHRSTAGIAAIAVGIAVIVAGFAAIGFGIVAILKRQLTLGIAAIVAGITVIGLGIAVILDHDLGVGIAAIAVGIAAIGLGTLAIGDQKLIGGITAIGVGIALIGAGIALILANQLTLGIAAIAAGITVTIAGKAVISTTRGGRYRDGPDGSIAAADPRPPAQTLPEGRVGRHARPD